MRRHLPPLNGLRAFEAAARHLSFTHAADELTVTPAAISHQVRALEERLGFALFTRSNNALELTQRGCAYLPFLTAAFDKMLEGTTRLNTRDGRARTTAQVMPTFGERWLLPRLPAFQAAYPETVLSLTVLSDAGRLGDGADAAIWYGGGDWPDFEAEKLFDEVLVPVASPKLLSADVPLSTPDAVLAYPLLRVSTTPEVWPLWLDALGLEDGGDDLDPRFETCGLAIQAAVEGLGVMMANRCFVEEELATGRLVVAYRFELPRDRGWYLCRPAGAAEADAVRRFRHWLLDQIELSRAA